MVGSYYGLAVETHLSFIIYNITAEISLRIFIFYTLKNAKNVKITL